MLDWTKLTPAVKRAAGAVVSKFPAHHSVSDVEQEMWVWIMENKKTITRILGDSEGTMTAVENLLVKAGNSYLKKEEAAIYGYAEEDQFYFSLDLIKSILEVVFIHEDWQSFAQAAQDGMPRAKSDPATSGDNLASYADVSRAISTLPEDLYNTLVWRYKYRYTFAQIANEAGTALRTAQYRHEAAVKAIQQALGKRDLSEFRQGYEGRTATSVTRGNVGRGDTAQHIVERDYEG